MPGQRRSSGSRSATVHVPFPWVENDPVKIGLISSSGIVTTHDVPAAVETRAAVSCTEPPAWR